MFLLDTNVVSELGRPVRQEPVLQFIDRIRGEIAICPSTAFEAARGFMNKIHTAPEKAWHHQRWFEDFLRSGVRCLETDAATAFLAGTMSMVKALRHLWVTVHETVPGKPTPPPKPGKDLEIAATSIVHRVPIATINVKDFVLIDRYFPLPGVLNPVTGEWAVKLDPSLWAMNWSESRPPYPLEKLTLSQVSNLVPSASATQGVVVPKMPRERVSNETPRLKDVLNPGNQH